MNACDINDINAEAGVVASLILRPGLVFYSEQLTPHHFTNEANGYMYYAIQELAKKDIGDIDAYNIVNVLNTKTATREKASTILTVPAINEFIDNAPLIARRTPEEYKMVVDAVMSAAFRRSTYNKLLECQQLCFNSTDTNIEQKIYSSLDDVMMQYSCNQPVPAYKDVVDKLWAEIEERQDSQYSGMPFKFPSLNEYVTIEKGELIVFGGAAKSGKSMMLLNCAVDLLKQGQSVLYIDSELNSRMFTARLVSHLTGIEYSRIKAGAYNETEKSLIIDAIAWVKTKKFTHIYMPIFDIQGVYATVKKVNHMCGGLDVLIVDYFKSAGEDDAYSNYASLGRFVDTIKNEICGKMNIAGLGAAQKTESGRLADSAKIARNASTIIMIDDKTPEEIAQDGPQCGNRKLHVSLNRNGMQMAQGEYIDLLFEGNTISYKEAEQHASIEEPY